MKGSKKTVFRLPLVAGERDVDVFAGTEHIAKYIKGEDVWYIKVASCSKCGECCTKLPYEIMKKSGLLPVSKNGVCKYLSKETGGIRECGRAGMMPHACAIGDDAGEDYCSVRWEKLKK